MLSDKQIKIGIDYCSRVIADRGLGLVTKGLIAKFARHLNKILEDERQEIIMISIAGRPLDTLSRAIKSAKIENPFPVEWFDIVFIDTDKAKLYQDNKYVKDLE